MSNLFKSKKLRTWAMIAAMVLALFLAGQIFLSGKANAAATSSEEKVTSVAHPDERSAGFAEPLRKFQRNGFLFGTQ